MSWFKTGWGEVNEEGAKSAFENKGPRRIWIPPDTSRRFLLLEDDPTGLWEHGYQLNGKWGNFEPCKTKNKMDDRCPICDSGDKMWPHFTGFLSAMSMTSWFTEKDKREICYQREIFGFRMGSKDKPGALKRIERIKANEGRLKGLVIEYVRLGSKTEEYNVVERIDPATIEDYGRQLLADYVKRVNAKLPAKDHVTVDKLLEKHPWKPINFDKLFKTDWEPKSLATLDRMFGRGGNAGGGGNDSSGGDSDESGSDDIPY